MQNVTKEEYLASLRRYVRTLSRYICSKLRLLPNLKCSNLITGRAVDSQEVYPSTEELQGMYLYKE